MAEEKNTDVKDLSGEKTILSVKNLVKRFPIKNGVFGRSNASVHAVEDVSFELRRKETLAIVGESGCGKSTTGKCVLRLTEPTSGTVELDGEDFTSLKGEDLKRARQKMKLIFQDPYSSLNPRMTVMDIIGEPIDIAGTYKTKAERDARIEEVMEEVGLNLEFKYRYPHEFSGGQRQRIGIARAIVLEPEIVVCDEPVSALDVSVQAKVINLLEELQKDHGLAYIFISHDLSVVRHIADTVMVMYLGHQMEFATKDALFERPLHPGDVPSPANPPSGCVFHTRCPKAMKVCSERIPERIEAEPGHFCACHLYDASLSDADRTPQVAHAIEAAQKAVEEARLEEKISE